jgi:hypothetical protein
MYDALVAAEQTVLAGKKPAGAVALG